MNTQATPNTPDTATVAFLDALNSATGPAIETLTPAEAREVLAGAQRSAPVDVSGIDVTRRTIEQDGLVVSLVVVKPQDSRGVLPVFMFFHSGGWILGDYPFSPTMARLSSWHCRKSVNSVSRKYRLFQPAGGSGSAGSGHRIAP
ncbi:hypothetical protein [Paraburkholderia sp. CI3]|uniref:hypothetical protein n=1 Tax=Paraburkholderia sp. CI3 TaxID=2991060 RepID=UPI003D243D5F